LPPGVKLEETAYRADFDLLEFYQGFSSELLRISMIGLAAIGALLSVGPVTSGAGKIIENLLTAANCRSNIIGAVLSFVVAAAFSLIHRYASSDSMAWHISVQRHATAKAENLISAQDTVAFDKSLKGQRLGRRIALAVSTWTIAISTLALIAAVISLGLALYHALPDAS
jgi:hypothetical protein